jgi:phosphoesterase RecJ-like protein
MRSGWKLDTQVANEALNQLKTTTRILLPTHQNVDADSLSSVLALTKALHQHDIDAVAIVSDGHLPRSLEFLPGVEDVLLYGRDEVPAYDMLCLADCSDRTRLGAFYRDDPTRVDGRIPMVNIDHHITNDHFGIVNIVEPTAASTTEIIADILAVWGTVMTKDVAQCLLAGIYGDTLGLRTESTTSRTMRTAADLVDAGGNPVPIVDALFRLKPKSSVCLWQRALERVQWTGELIWTELTEATFEECGAQPSEAEGMVNFLAGTEGSRAAAILYANSNGWRVSMRSLPVEVDVAAIAAEFGGGGHPRAAGVQIEGGEAEKQHFLERVAELIREPVVT